MHFDNKKRPSLINLGCGDTFHPFWTNISLVSTSPHVIEHDILKGLPFEDGSFDAAYSSHLVEHIKPAEVHKFLSEVCRILKKGGVMRLVVPDLERIALSYLKALEKVESGNLEAEANYDWMVLEMYDQSVRDFAGGEARYYLRNPNIKNREFIISRVGKNAFLNSTNIESKRWNVFERIRSKKLPWLLNRMRLQVAVQLVHLIAGRKAANAFKNGIFREYSGQIHRRMYDRFSLQRLMEVAGMKDIAVCRVDESRILNFNSFNLDIVNGTIRKPDSLFMEGVKP